MPEFHYQKLNGRMTLSDTQERLRAHYLTTLKDGTRVKEVLAREIPEGTRQQAAAHFGLIVEMIRQQMAEMGFDICGIAPNKKMIHDILKLACGGVGDNGEVKRFRDMNIAQRSKFFDNCRTWAATQLQLVIPDPDPNYKLNRSAK